MATVELAERSFWWVILGIALVILGLILLTVPVFSTLVSVLTFGVFLILASFLHIIAAFMERKTNHFLLHLLVAVLSFVVGALMVWNPSLSAISLTLLIAALFLTMGIFRIVSSIVYRFPQWGWVLFNGLITLLLGILILARWPSTGLWVIGLFVGIDFLFAGWTMIMLYFMLKNTTFIRA